jgi:D-tyrosyl-tRNA(Tyr) deacylase
MRAVIQRVKSAGVSIGDENISDISGGLLILLAVHRDDQEDKIAKLADKISKLRICADESGKMNKSILEAGGEILVVSQFTLYGDSSGGNRPSFIASARPEKAEPFYRRFLDELKKLGVKKVAEGRFGAYMEVSLVNDGPTTIIIDI